MREQREQCPLPLSGRGWREAPGEGRDARENASPRARALSFVTALLVFATPLFAGSARRIEREAVVRAPRAAVWKAWSSTEGVKTFFAPNANIELTPGGPYEILFDMAQPAGLRGGETNKVVAFEPERMLLFSWNAPPKFGPLRNEHTYVLLRFDDVPGGGTRVRLTHFGWREADQWNAIYDYFDKAWSYVMTNFSKAY